ncbi:hypothetical protein LNP25_10795 [Klebsiella variicola subsp. variicola]|nr:hypothetical protein [Klebsiella variicola subsp. variicola]
MYDDFAHHPTAILATLQALRGKWAAPRVFSPCWSRALTP